jgi:hypothetical protein
MKCIHCGHDSKYKERTDRTCPGCHKKFAFEPKAGDPITDRGFQNAIDAVSERGEVRWGVEHLYYEVCRHKRVSKTRGIATTIGLFVVAAVCTGAALAGGHACWLGSLAGVVGGTVALLVLLLADYDHARLDAADFRRLYDRWCEVHGTPKSVILRQPPGPPPKLEPDVADYSFDRAVISDRARTVDLLLANNFHFENNCAVLSVEGYPQGVFETVRTMLKRNPQLRVYALHDASAAGCRLAHKLAADPAWFAGKVRIIDVGLRPGHAERFRGLLQRSRDSAVAAIDGITAAEAAWLSSHVLELAAVRPAQVLKRLFRAMNATAMPAKTASEIDGDGGGAVVLMDGGSFASDATVIDASVDAFG